MALVVARGTGLRTKGGHAVVDRVVGLCRQAGFRSGAAAWGHRLLPMNTSIAGMQKELVVPALTPCRI